MADNQSRESIENSGYFVMNDDGIKASGGLSVKIDVDISEALTGLKALQREAKEATKLLRELEDVKTGDYDKRTAKHTARYLVVDLGEPTNESITFTINCPFHLAYITDTLRAK
jgi:hypothetical protein